jgi:hypothetical protein
VSNAILFCKLFCKGVGTMNTHVRCAKRFPAIWKGLPLLLVLLMPAASRAELFNHFATALPGWSGTTHLNESGKPDVFVDYAVYARDAFNAAFGDVDPANHDPYVYTYQLRNATGSPQAITKFTVGLDSDSMSAAQIITQTGDPELPVGVATSLAPAFAPASVPYTSAAWTFNTIGVGAKSEILLFTSLVLPQWLPTTVKGTSLPPETGSVPSPVPEPFGLIGLLIAGAMFLLVRPFRSGSLR